MRLALGASRGSHRPATPVRKRAARRVWGHRRAAVRILGQRSVGRLLRHRNRWYSPLVRTHHRSGRVPLDDGGGHGKRHCIRRAAGRHGVAHGADSGAQEGRRLARLPPFTLWGRVSRRASLNLGRAGHRRRSLDPQRSNAPFGSRFRCRARCVLSNEATPERLRSRESFKLFPQSAAPPRIAWRGGLRCIRPVSTGGSAWRCGGFSTRPCPISAGRSDPCAAASCHAWIFRDAGHTNRQGPGFRCPRFPTGPASRCRRSGPGGAAVARYRSHRYRLCSSKDVTGRAPGKIGSPTKSSALRSTKASAPAAQHLARLFSAPIGRPPPDRDACWCV